MGKRHIGFLGHSTKHDGITVEQTIKKDFEQLVKIIRVETMRREY